MAVLAVLKWRNCYRADADIWIDAKFVASGLTHILEHGFAGPWSHLGLWDQILERLQGISDLRCVPHCVPSHLDEELVVCPFEDLGSRMEQQS